jgi:hypothetical protein
MNDFPQKRRRSPDLFSLVLLVVGMALSLTLVAQAQAAGRPMQPQLAGQCLTSLSVVDLRVPGDNQAGVSHCGGNLDCPRVTRKGLRVLGVWAPR